MSRWSAWTSSGLAGIVLATGLAAFALGRRGHPPVLALALLGAGLVAFVVTAKLTELVLRRPALVVLHQLAVVTLLSLPVAAAAGVPAPDTLDAVAVGLLGLVSVGRIGCLLVGCCHGRPAGWGVRYGAGPVQAGFPPHLAGVRLVPVQALESGLAAALLVAAVTVLAAGDTRPGQVAAAVTAGYATVRFGLEFWRGDGPRATWAGLTHAQWTCWAILAAVTLTGSLRGGWVAWQAAAAAAATVVLMVRVVRHPALGEVRHEHELARALALVSTVGDVPQLARTSAGVAVSGGRAESDGRSWSHYTLSFPPGVGPRRIRSTALLVHRLRDSSAGCVVLPRGERRVQVVLAHPARS